MACFFSKWRLLFLAVLTSSLLSAPLQAQPLSPLDAFKRAGIALSDVSLYAIAIDQIQPKIAHNSEALFALASTTKIATSLAALDILGPAFRWRTQAFTNGVVANGTLTGDLLIVGGGDPLLSSERLVAWFTQLQKRGVRDIVGNIVLNRQRFLLETKDHANTPVPDWRNPHHALPDAFIVDEGVVKLTINSSSNSNSNSGQSAEAKQVALTPAIEGIELADQTQTLARCSAIKKPLTADFDLIAEQRKLVLTGEWAKDCAPMSVEALPLSHAEVSAAAVLAAWKKAGGTLSGSVLEAAPLPKPNKLSKQQAKLAARTRARKPFAVLESAQLFDAIKQVNKWSNNVVARNLMMSLSPNFPREPATLPKAQLAVKDWLQTKGFSSDDITIENGSGLSRTERGKSRALATLLRDAWYSRVDKDFKASLSVAGVDGTMGSRLKRSGAAGKALIKTGTLSDTRAVAGYVTTKTNQVYAIAAIVNNANASRAVAALDHFIDWVYENGQ